MQAQNQEIYVVILIATALALLLVGFIVTSLFLYQRRQHRQEQQLVRMKDEYQQELLRSQLEIQETTFKTIAMELHDNIGQVLSVVKLSLSVLPLDKDHPAYESVLNSRQMLNKVIYDMGNLTKSLHTDRIAQIGLVEAMRFDLEHHTQARRATDGSSPVEVAGRVADHACVGVGPIGPAREAVQPVSYTHLIAALGHHRSKTPGH